MTIQSLLLTISYAKAGGLTIMPAPIKNTAGVVIANPSWVVKTINAGDTLTGKLLVKNLDNIDHQVWVHAVDSTLSTTGEFAIAPNSEIAHHIGVWSRANQPNFTLHTNEKLEIGYTIRIPTRTQQGKYSGAFIIQTNDDNDGDSVGISSRVGARIYVSVTSDLPEWQQIVELPDDNTSTKKSYINTVEIHKDGAIHFPMHLQAKNEQPYVDFPKDIKLTKADGSPYNCTVSPPISTPVNALPLQPPANLQYRSAIKIDTCDDVFLSDNVKVTMPLPPNVTPSMLTVLYYDKDSGSYKTAGDGGVVSNNGLSVVTSVDHFTTFVAVEEKAPSQSNNLGGSLPLYLLETLAPESGVKTIPPNCSNRLLPFKDANNHWAYEFIKELYCRGIVQGRTQNAFQPDSPITRAEMVKIALLNFDYKISSKKCEFADIGTNAWYRKYVCTAKSAKIISGYSNGLFKPDQPVTRAEALKILLLASKTLIDKTTTESTFNDIPTDAWYAAQVNFAAKLKIIEGKSKTTFAPEAKITRGEMAKIAVKIKKTT